MIFMDYIKKLIFYAITVYFIFLIGSNIGGNSYSKDKSIIKRKNNINVTLKDIVVDVTWIILCLVAGTIAIIFYPDDRLKLIVILILGEIAFITVFIKHIKSYRKTKESN